MVMICLLAGPAQEASRRYGCLLGDAQKRERDRKRALEAQKTIEGS